MSLTTIRTKYENTKCRRCKAAIPYNGLCRYDRSIRGVACMACEPESTTNGTTNGTTYTAPTSAADPQLQASLADGRALRTEVGRLQSLLTLANETIALQSQSLRGLAVERDVQTQVAETLRSERDALRSRLLCYETGTETRQALAEEPIDDGDDLIDVMAPGGVERWLEHDLAQIAAEKAARERQAIPTLTEQQAQIAESWGAIEDSADDDCPI